MKSKHLVHGAVIAALYASLTVLTMPISYGIMQIRIAEALTVLPAFMPAAIPGLFIGCVISNMLGPNGIIDIVFGSLATLLAGILTYKLRHNSLLIPLPPVLANGTIVGAILYYVYGVPAPLLSCILWVGAGEAVACYGLGLPLAKYLAKRSDVFQ